VRTSEPIVTTAGVPGVSGIKVLPDGEEREMPVGERDMVVPEMVAGGPFWVSVRPGFRIKELEGARVMGVPPITMGVPGARGLLVT
jgi:hypothetical protein